MDDLPRCDDDKNESSESSTTRRKDDKTCKIRRKRREADDIMESENLCSISLPICPSEDKGYSYSSRSTGGSLDKDYSSSEKSSASDNDSVEESFNKCHDTPTDDSSKKLSKKIDIEKSKQPSSANESEDEELQPKDKNICEFEDQIKDTSNFLDNKDIKSDDLICFSDDDTEIPKQVSVPSGTLKDIHLQCKEEEENVCDVLSSPKEERNEISCDISSPEKVEEKNLCDVSLSFQEESSIRKEPDEKISYDEVVPCEIPSTIKEENKEIPCDMRSSVKNEDEVSHEIPSSSTSVEKEASKESSVQESQHEDQHIEEPVSGGFPEEEFLTEIMLTIKTGSIDKPLSISPSSSVLFPKYISAGTSKNSIESLTETELEPDEIVFPSNENYDEITVNWEKYYDFVPGTNYLKLVKDDRHMTEVSFSKGNLKSEEGTEYTLSETDLLQSGFHSLFFSAFEDKSKTSAPDVTETLKSLQDLPSNMKEVERWLKKEIKLMNEIENKKEKLTKIAKELLTEIKYLKTINAKLNKDFCTLESEINHHPNKQDVFVLKKKCQNLKDQINVLNYKHGRLLIKKEQRYETFENESRVHHNDENTLLIRVEELKEENRELRNHLESFHNDAINVYQSLIKKLNAFLQEIGNLSSLSELAKTYLEKNCNSIKELQQLVEENNLYFKKIYDNVDNMEKYIEHFNSTFDPLDAKSNDILDYINNLNTEIKELVKNFNTVNDFLNQNEIRNFQVKDTVGELNTKFNLLKEEKKQILDVGIHITKFEKLVEEETNKCKTEKTKFKKESEQKRLQRNYFEDKLAKLFYFLEEMEEMIAELKADQDEEVKIDDDELKSESADDDAEVPDKKKFSKTFIRSDATKDGVYTTTGLSSFEEIRYPQKITEDIPKCSQIWKTKLSCGYKNLTSIPEDIQEQLSGVYGTFSAKDTVSTQLQDS
ncbi:myosin heavy chain, clone 203-like [Centruroides vittatus]|uniref:myosin heavy chain, clone 203-like n=1 Tax=Centruroides vittatus TaxID=120091 RepID=UPI0035102AD9